MSTSPALVIPAATGTPTHLIVLLHGVGASARDLEPIARALGAALPAAELVLPDGFHAFDGGPAGRQWFSVRGVTEYNRPARVAAAGAEVAAWIDAEVARRGLPAAQVSIVGFSQGAIVGAWLALHRQPAPAAVVMLSGRVAEAAPLPPSTTRTRVLIAHGTDDRVMPLAVVEPGARLLEAAGAQVTTRVYPGLGHTIGAEELADVRAFLVEALAP